MTDLYVWLAVAVLGAATWIAALKLALIGPSRTLLTLRLEDRGRVESATWLSRNFDSAIFAVSLVLTIGQLSLFALVLAETVQLRTEASLSWSNLLISGLISVTVLWVFTSVVATALARHVGAGLVSTGLPPIRLITRLCRPLTMAVSFIDEVVRRLSGANLRNEDETEAELLRSIDRSAFLKWKRLLTPDDLTDVEKRKLKRYDRWRRLWPFNRKELGPSDRRAREQERARRGRSA